MSTKPPGNAHPSGAFAALDQYDRASGLVQELDDGVDSHRWRQRSHARLLTGKPRPGYPTLSTGAIRVRSCPESDTQCFEAGRGTQDHYPRMINKDTVVAANRFGLGARPGELEHIGEDPRGWLKSQIDQTPQLPSQLATLKPSDAVLRAFFAVREARKDKRDAAARGDPVQNAGGLIRDALLPHYLAQAEARVRVAAHTEAPFHERLVQFWSNHFAVSIDKPVCLGIAGALENEGNSPARHRAFQ